MHSLILQQQQVLGQPLIEMGNAGMKDHAIDNLSVYSSFVNDLKKYQSKEEKILWAQLNEGKWKDYHFLRRHPVIVYKKDNTISFYIADFYCEEMKLVLEIDRLKNNCGTDNIKAHDFIMKKLELQVIRISKDEIIKNLSAVLKKIRIFIKQLNISPVFSDTIF